MNKSARRRIPYSMELADLLNMVSEEKASGLSSFFRYDENNAKDVLLMAIAEYIAAMTEQKPANRQQKGAIPDFLQDETIKEFLNAYCMKNQP